MNARALFVGIWIGLCAACIGWTSLGIWYTHTHPESDFCYTAWFVVMVYGPVILIAMRLWKWVLTLALASIGVHELHKLEKSMQAVVVLAGMWQLQKPHNQQRVASYWSWLTAKPSGPGALTGEARLLLRVGLVIGLSVYCSAADLGFKWQWNWDATTREKLAALVYHPETVPTPGPIPTPTPTPDPNWDLEQRELEQAIEQAAPTPTPRHITKRWYVKGTPASKQALAFDGMLVRKMKGKMYVWDNEDEKWTPLSE